MSELERAMAVKNVPEAQRVNVRISVQQELHAFARHEKAAKVKLYDLPLHGKRTRQLQGMSLKKQNPIEPDSEIASLTRCQS